MNAYHNTCGLEDTREFERKALSQDEAIMEWIQCRVFGYLFSPSQIHEMVMSEAPITSVRRSLTGLTKAGLLIRTDMLVDGPYGRPEGLWKLAEPVQTNLF